MQFVNVILIRNDVVDEAHLLFDAGKAELKFTELCEQHFPTWNLLDADAKLRYLEDGYFQAYNGADGYDGVFLTWPVLADDCVLSNI